MQWIANTIGKLLRKNARPVCVLSLTQDDVRMEVLQYLLPCGHTACGVFLTYRMKDDEWVPIGSLRDFNLDAAVELLQRAQQCITYYSE